MDQIRVTISRETRHVTYEGSPENLEAALAVAGERTSPAAPVIVSPASPAAPVAPVAVAEDDDWIPTEASVRARLGNDPAFVKRTLESFAPTNAQLELYRVLLRLPVDEVLTRAQIAAAMGITEDQVNGVLGGLGARINKVSRPHPEIAIGIGILLMLRQRADGWTYALRPVARAYLAERFGTNAIS